SSRYQRKRNRKKGRPFRCCFRNRAQQPCDIPGRKATFGQQTPRNAQSQGTRGEFRKYPKNKETKRNRHRPCRKHQIAYFQRWWTRFRPQAKKVQFQTEQETKATGAHIGLEPKSKGQSHYRGGRL